VQIVWDWATHTGLLYLSAQIFDMIAIRSSIRPCLTVTYQYLPAVPTPSSVSAASLSGELPT